ncbi:MAG: hypothetical protein OCC49_07555 [Fibrobacterales bacterium]
MKKVFSRIITPIAISTTLLLSACSLEELTNDFVALFIKEIDIDKNRSLTVKQLIAYKRLTSALITLDEKFIEELKKTPEEEREEILMTLNQTRDALVKKFDFKDYNEYLWIDSVAIIDPVNQSLAKTAGIEILRNK